MPSTRDIRRRIRSVKNTAQITKAMQMVASSKMRKAQLAALAGRPYSVLMNQVILSASKNATDFVHPLMEKRETRKRGVLAVTTDKGLCGALNSNMGREVMKWDKDTTVYVTAGRVWLPSFWSSIAETFCGAFMARNSRTGDPRAPSRKFAAIRMPDIGVIWPFSSTTAP